MTVEQRYFIAQLKSIMESLFLYLIKQTLTNDTNPRAAELAPSKYASSIKGLCRAVWKRNH